jgi:hypothetical protein
MGFFYTNISLRTIDRRAIAQQLSVLQRRAYVLPPSNGFVVVCDAECDEQDVNALATLAAHLSKQLACVALPILNHDDDVLWYRLYSTGTLLDEYNSSPNYFSSSTSREPAGGNAAQLCKVFNKAQYVTRVESILRRHDFTYAYERHLALAKTLGLPQAYCHLGYLELSREDENSEKDSAPVRTPSRTWVRQFTNTDDVPKPFDLAKEVRRLVRRNRKISAMDLYRRHTGCSLQEARSHIESL